MKRSDRDVDLGEQLRRLEVPEHAPDFFATLEERLQDIFASQTPAPSVPSASAGRGGHRESARSCRGRLRLLWIPVLVAVVILALLWAFAGPLGIDFFRPQIASAAAVMKKVVAAVADAKALRGTMVVIYADTTSGASSDTTEATSGDKRDEMRWTFLCTAEGDFRLTGVTRREDLSFDHRTGTQLAISGGENGEQSVASEMTGLAVGPPDPGPADWVLERRLGAVVRALLDSPDAQVEEGSYEDRAVWTLSTDVQANRLSDVSGDYMVVTVDKATGFPVRIVETRDGSFVQELRLEGLEIDPVLSADSFVLRFPAGAEVMQYDSGFRRIDLAHLATQAAAVVGYDPLLPARIPPGFVLTAVAVAESGQSTGKEGMNPQSRGVVSAVYRRGFDRLVVSTRLVGPDRSLWSDPLASGEGFIDEPETVALTVGAFAGSRAELLIDPRAVPHLWVMNEALVATISGDLTRTELVAAAESLAAAP